MRSGLLCRAAAWFGRRSAVLLLGVTAVGLAAGGLAWLAGGRGAADACWLIAAAFGLGYALWSAVDAIRRGRLGVDVIALLAQRFHTASRCAFAGVTDAVRAELVLTRAGQLSRCLLHRACRLVPARGEPGLPGAGQLVHHAGPARDGHQYRLGAALYLRADTGGEAQVGGNQAHPAQRPEFGDVGGDQGSMQRGPQPLCRDGAGEAERAPDVLVVDERLDQADPATQRGGDPAGLQVVSKEGQQLFRAVPVVSCERHVVDAAGPEPGLGRDRDKSAAVLVVVADDVRHHVPDPPPRAQRRRVPLMR